MGLSDCVKCWDTPCACGYEYRNDSKETIAQKMASMLSFFNKEDSIDVVKSLHSKILENKD